MLKASMAQVKFICKHPTAKNRRRSLFLPFLAWDGCGKIFSLPRNVPRISRGGHVGISVDPAR